MYPIPVLYVLINTGTRYQIREPVNSNYNTKYNTNPISYQKSVCIFIFFLFSFFYYFFFFLLFFRHLLLLLIIFYNNISSIIIMHHSIYYNGSIIISSSSFIIIFYFFYYFYYIFLVYSSHILNRTRKFLCILSIIYTCARIAKDTLYKRVSAVTKIALCVCV